jgi:broad specificity phosphatase PhoE
MQGKTYHEADKGLDWAFESWEKDPSVRVPQGESFSEFQGRVFAFLQTLLQAVGEDETVAVVTHTRVCSYLVALTMNAGKMLTGENLKMMMWSETQTGNYFVLVRKAGMLQLVGMNQRP